MKTPDPNCKLTGPPKSKWVTRSKAVKGTGGGGRHHSHQERYPRLPSDSCLVEGNRYRPISCLIWFSQRSRTSLRVVWNNSVFQCWQMTAVHSVMVKSGFWDQTAWSWMAVPLPSGTHNFIGMSVFLIRKTGTPTTTDAVELFWGWNDRISVHTIILTRKKGSAVATVIWGRIWPAGFRSVTSAVGRDDVWGQKNGQEQLLKGWPCELEFCFPYLLEAGWPGKPFWEASAFSSNR